MVHKLFRIPLLVAAAAMILAACSAPTPTAAPATVPPAGEVKWALYLVALPCKPTGMATWKSTSWTATAAD